MRYTIEKENHVKQLAAEGKNVDYIASVTGIPPKVIWGWCPELRPHDDIIKWSVKQRFHFLYPDLEAKISSAFSPYIRQDITDKQWDDINKIIYDTLFEESVAVFRNALLDPPSFGNDKKLSNDNFIDYLKVFWNKDSEYAIENNLSDDYIKKNRDSIHYWSFLRKKLLRDITKGDIEIMFEKINEKGLSASRVKSIMNVGLIPLKFAYKKGLTQQRSYEFILPKIIKLQNPLTDNLAYKIFNDSWNNQESFIANLIAFETKMQFREVRALRLGDIFTEGYIKTTNIYDNSKGLQHNPNERIIKVSKSLINLILRYTSTSKFKDFQKTDYVFFTENRDKPASAKYWTNDLKNVCSKYTDNIKHIGFGLWAKSIS